MSKMDNLRAMREARYARTAGKPAPARPKPLVAPREDTPAAAPADGLCGYRSMNGRTCTREAGHAAKSHRYS